LDLETSKHLVQQITNVPNLATIKGFVHTTIELFILFMFATRNMGIPDLSIVSLLNSTTSPLPHKKKILEVKIKINKIVEEISTSVNIHIKFSQTL